MGTYTREITPKIAMFIREQTLFFVATAPPEGPINVSPKGVSGLHVLSPTRVAYVDYPGSGDETARHLREDARITLMLCSFSHNPGIVRLYGQARVLSREEAVAENPGLPAAELTPNTRHVFMVDVEQAQWSCGYGVPIFDEPRPRPQGAAMQG